MASGKDYDECFTWPDGWKFVRARSEEDALHLLGMFERPRDFASPEFAKACVGLIDPSFRRTEAVAFIKFMRSRDGFWTMLPRTIRARELSRKTWRKIHGVYTLMDDLGILSGTPFKMGFEAFSFTRKPPEMTEESKALLFRTEQEPPEYPPSFEAAFLLGEMPVELYDPIQDLASG